MNKLLLIFSLLFSSSFIYAQTGYQIKIGMKPFRNEKLYLAYYYGKMKAIADSTKLDATGNGVFKGKQTLPGGIYFIVSPKKEILFEVLLDKPQQFSITADTTDLPFTVKFNGSTVNTQFQSYTTFATRTGQMIQTTMDEYKTAKTGKDSAVINAKVKKLNDRMQKYRDSIVNRSPNSVLATLFKAIREPEIPAATKHPGGKYDSNYAYTYYKNHFWDGIAFNDERLVRTPFFEPKLEKYYRELVAPHPDSIKKEVDKMLVEARTSKEMFKYLLVHFVQKYINPEYMGQDAVFVHLFEKYINTGMADFFTAQYKEFATKRAYSLMANLVGKPAANLELTDTTGKPTPLYGVDAPYTIVCFWDPGCSHCKEVVPKVDSFYKAKWKKMGVKVYAVKVDGTREDWIKFIHNHDLQGWVHVFQRTADQEKEVAAGKPGFRQLYDVYQTPMLYLLDKEKRIIAKKLTYHQIDEVIALKSKSQKSE